MNPGNWLDEAEVQYLRARCQLIVDELRDANVSPEMVGDVTRIVAAAAERADLRRLRELPDELLNLAHGLSESRLARLRSQLLLQKRDEMESTQGRIRFGEWLLWYLGGLAAFLIVAFGAFSLWGPTAIPSLTGVVGTLFLAVSARPKSAAFRMLRNIRGIAEIKSDDHARVTLAVTGMITLIASVLIAIAMSIQVI